MKHTHLNGRRYINLVRCSNDEQADTSPEDQTHILDDFAIDNGMIHAGADEILEGVSGSVPAARTDIDRIIRRKRNGEDFDVVLIQDFSRFTRGGIEHSGKIKWDLAEAGIDVIFVTSGSTGDFDQDSLIQSVGFFAAQQTAKNISYAATRGQMSALEAGIIPHACHVPYGVDRAYVGPDGKCRHRIRNLVDGTQQQLDAERDTVLASYGKNPKKGASPHYRRQSDERIEFVPGDVNQVEVVRRIYRMKLLQGYGTYRIAKSLNDEGIASPTGRLWGTDTIKQILTNPTYTGVGIADRYATGIYHVRGEKAAPQAVHRDLRTIAQRRKTNVQYRPKDQWKWQNHPRLVDFLGSDLRELAVAMHEKEFEKQHQKAIAPAKKTKPGGDKHGDSPYILKNLLRTKQGDHPMCGVLCGPKNDRRRYYRLSRGISKPQTGSILSAMIAAEPLERAVLDAVKDVLLDVPNLRETVECAIAKDQQDQADGAVLEDLLAEREKIVEQVRDLMNVGPSIRKLMMKEFDQWEARLTLLEERITKAQASSPDTAVDVDALVATTAARLEKLAEGIGKLPPAAMRELLGTLITSLEVDMETRGVEMELTLPPPISTIGDFGDRTAGLRLVPVRPTPWPNETQWLNGLKIAKIFCQGQRGSNKTPPCFQCSRKAA